MAKEKRDLKINKGTKKENTTKKGMGLSTKIFIALLVGAIWCEWGLKYVAKMNDKGDFVLI